MCLVLTAPPLIPGITDCDAELQVFWRLGYGGIFVCEPAGLPGPQFGVGAAIATPPVDLACVLDSSSSLSCDGKTSLRRPAPKCNVTV